MCPLHEHVVIELYFCDHFKHYLRSAAWLFWLTSLDNHKNVNEYRLFYNIFKTTNINYSRKIFQWVIFTMRFFKWHETAHFSKFNVFQMADFYDVDKWKVCGYNLIHINCFRCIQEVNVIEEQVNLRDEACQSVMAVILLVLCATQADEAAPG